MHLEALGWNERLREAFAPHAATGLVPARVAVEHKSRFGTYAEQGDVEAKLSGRLRHVAAGRLDLPAVGDWVALEAPARDAVATIVAVLPRASLFTRKAAGREHEAQIVAANVDVVFIVTSLNDEFNARRLERYLALAWESGARPVVVLSKADVVADPEARRRDVEAIALGVPVLLTSAKSAPGVQELLAHLTGHRTGALLGSSGVGKSTLINVLVGFERQATAEIRRSDDSGRHTTTRRELVLLPGGGLLIDTPGMRELQLADAAQGVLATFEDVDSLAAGCAFRDCTHGPEPDCAVKAAIAGGKLDSERLQSYHKLVAELARRERQVDQRAAAQVRSRDKAAARALRSHVKKKRS